MKKSLFLVVLLLSGCLSGSFVTNIKYSDLMTVVEKKTPLLVPMTVEICLLVNEDHQKLVKNLFLNPRDGELFLGSNKLQAYRFNADVPITYSLEGYEESSLIQLIVNQGEGETSPYLGFFFDQRAFNEVQEYLKSGEINFDGIKITFLLENDSDKDISISGTSAYVNGEPEFFQFDWTVPQGKTLNIVSSKIQNDYILKYGHATHFIHFQETVVAN